MPANRIEQLQKYYDEDPRDPFNLYALAIEYLNSEPVKSLSLFEDLLRNHPKYLPTYYHVARLYQDLGEKGKAITAYEDGIRLAKENHDLKTVRELRSAYDEMMFE